MESRKVESVQSRGWDQSHHKIYNNSGIEISVVLILGINDVNSCINSIILDINSINSGISGINSDIYSIRAIGINLGTIGISDINSGIRGINSGFNVRRGTGLYIYIYIYIYICTEFFEQNKQL